MWFLISYRLALASSRSVAWLHLKCSTSYYYVWGHIALSAFSIANKTIVTRPPPHSYDQHPHFVGLAIPGCFSAQFMSKLGFLSHDLQEVMGHIVWLQMTHFYNFHLNCELFLICNYILLQISTPVVPWETFKTYISWDLNRIYTPD